MPHTLNGPSALSGPITCLILLQIVHFYVALVVRNFSNEDQNSLTYIHINNNNVSS